MARYKVRPYRDGLFKVWKLKDFGNGYAWDDVSRVFRSEEDANNYVKEQKGDDKNDAK